MVEGGCLCASVRYSATGFTGIYMCHCSRCRKAFGGAASAAAMVPRDGFCWLQGQDSLRVYEMPSGFKRFFCPDCGSVLPQFVEFLDQWWIPAGTLDEDPGVPLTAHIHVDSAAAWDVIADGLPQFGESFV